MDKDYTTGARGINELAYWNKAGLEYMNREHLSPERPRSLEPGKQADVKLRADAPDADADVTLKLRSPGDGVGSAMVVRLNGTVLKHAGREKNWDRYDVEPGDVADGMNTVSCELDAGSERAVTIDDLVLSVRY